MPVPADCWFYIRNSLVDRLEEFGPAWKFYDLRLIPDAVRDPTAIYEDLNREGYDDACCYSYKPGFRWAGDSEQEAAPMGRFFVVYCEPASGGLIVMDFGWRAEDPNSPGNPQGWETFKKGKVWPKT
jgi:hypothetical protein